MNSGCAKHLSHILSHMLLTPVGLADLFDRSPLTIKGKMSKSPELLPPMIVVGRKIRLFLRPVVSAWIASCDTISGKVTIDISGLPPQLRSKELASLLHLADSSIASMRCRSPDSLPPGGKFGLWDTVSVFNWLLDHLVGLDRSQVDIVTSLPGRLSTGELLLSCSTPKAEREDAT